MTTADAIYDEMVKKYNDEYIEKNYLYSDMIIPMKDDAVKLYNIITSNKISNMVKYMSYVKKILTTALVLASVRPRMISYQFEGTSFLNSFLNLIGGIDCIVRHCHNTYAELIEIGKTETDKNDKIEDGNIDKINYDEIGIGGLLADIITKPFGATSYSKFAYYKIINTLKFNEILKEEYGSEQKIDYKQASVIIYDLLRVDPKTLYVGTTDYLKPELRPEYSLYCKMKKRDEIVNGYSDFSRKEQVLNTTLDAVKPIFLLMCCDSHYIPEKIPGYTIVGLTLYNDGLEIKEGENKVGSLIYNLKQESGDGKKTYKIEIKEGDKNVKNLEIILNDDNTIRYKSDIYSVNRKHIFVTCQRKANKSVLINYEELEPNSKKTIGSININYKTVNGEKILDNDDKNKLTDEQLKFVMSKDNYYSEYIWVDELNLQTELNLLINPQGNGTMRYGEHCENLSEPADRMIIYNSELNLYTCDDICFHIEEKNIKFYTRGEGDHYYTYFTIQHICLDGDNVNKNTYRETLNFNNFIGYSSIDKILYMRDDGLKLYIKE